MIDPDLLDDGLIDDVLARLGAPDNWHDMEEHEIDSWMAQLSEMTPFELMDNYLAWNGIHGYTDEIMRAVDSIRAAEAGGRYPNTDDDDDSEK